MGEPGNRPCVRRGFPSPRLPRPMPRCFARWPDRYFPPPYRPNPGITAAASSTDTAAPEPHSTQASPHVSHSLPRLRQREGLSPPPTRAPQRTLAADILTPPPGGIPVGCRSISWCGTTPAPDASTPTTTTPPILAWLRLTWPTADNFGQDPERVDIDIDSHHPEVARRVWVAAAVPVATAVSYCRSHLEQLKSRFTDADLPVGCGDSLWEHHRIVTATADTSGRPRDQH
jgi:hypothetical protein